MVSQKTNRRKRIRSHLIVEIRYFHSISGEFARYSLENIAPLSHGIAVDDGWTDWFYNGLVILQGSRYHSHANRLPDLNNTLLVARQTYGR